MLTLQSANLGELQCGLVPDLGIDSDFNFVRPQRIGIVLVELDSAVGEWTVRVEEEIRERKLKTGIGSVFWTTRTTTRPVWMTGLMGVMWFAGMVGLVRMVGFVRVVGSTRMVRSVRMARFVRGAGLVRVVGLVGLVRLVGMIRVIRRVRRFGPTGAVSAVAVGTRMFDLLRLRPMSVLVTF